MWAKGLWALGGPWPVPDVEPGITVAIKYGPSLTCKPYMRGAYVSRHLSFLVYGKALEGNAIAANPAWAGEIRPSGIVGGLAET